MRPFLLVTFAIAFGGISAFGAQPATAPKPTAASDASTEIAALKKRIAELEERQTPELGQQMLELQIRHARLWFAASAGNWNLAGLQLHELDEALDRVVEGNPDHAALQPQRLADVLPSIMKPAVHAARDAIDRKDKAAFASAYDSISNACTACHKVAGIDFLVLQRPRTPILDNLRAEPPAK